MVATTVYMVNKEQCGATVVIDIDHATRTTDIKAKLAKKTGVPVEAQKLLMTGVGQIWMGDKRTNIRFSSCGEVNGIESAVDLARRGLMPFSPNPSFNLTDNSGTWVEQPYN